MIFTTSIEINLLIGFVVGGGGTGMPVYFQRTGRQKNKLVQHCYSRECCFLLPGADVLREGRPRVQKNLTGEGTRRTLKVLRVRLFLI